MKNQKNGNGEEKGLVCTCCTHYGNGGGSWARGAVLRIALALFISLVIFWLGVKAGEFKSEFCGCNFNRFHGGYYMMGGYGGGMMQGNVVPGKGLIPQGGVAPTSTGTGPNVY